MTLCRRVAHPHSSGWLWKFLTTSYCLNDCSLPPSVSFCGLSSDALCFPFHLAQALIHPPHQRSAYVPAQNWFYLSGASPGISFEKHQGHQVHSFGRVWIHSQLGGGRVTLANQKTTTPWSWPPIQYRTHDPSYPMRPLPKPFVGTFKKRVVFGKAKKQQLTDSWGYSLSL